MNAERRIQGDALVFRKFNSGGALGSDHICGRGFSLGYLQCQAKIGSSRMRRRRSGSTEEE